MGTCRACDGTGVCKTCKGSGYTESAECQNQLKIDEAVLGVEK